MIQQHSYTLVFTLVFYCTIACTAPDEVHTPTTNGPMDGADDEVGELPPLDPESSPEPLSNGYCVAAEEPPYEGIRHHCGGTLDLSISGDALGNEVKEDIFVDFGPDVPGDSYEHPRVAACCGEYDFEQLASSQPAYWKNCLYDAVQQTCASLPYYVWDMAAAAKAEKKYVIADQLTKLGNDLASGDGQFECIEALFGSGPLDSFNVITGTKWNPAYDVWISVDFLEILEVALPEDPNADIQAQLVPNGASELLLGTDSSGALLLGALQLRGGPMTVEGVEIDRWQISSLRTPRGAPQSDRSFSVSAGGAVLRGGGRGGW